MRHVLFLLLITQSFFYSHTANTKKTQTGIQALIAASKQSKDTNSNANLALDYLWRAGSNRTLKPSPIAKRTLTQFGVDKNHPGGTLKKVMDTTRQTPMYKFTRDKNPVQRQTVKPPVIHGGGKKMVQEDKNGPVRATKRAIKDMLQDVTDVKNSLLGKQVKHNKTGNLYTVFGITIGVATQAPMVHYKDAQNVEWTRTLDDFLSVDTIEGSQVQKFTLIKK